MTRHSKNCTAGTVYTYSEKKRDTSASGYGSKSARLGKDSQREFDCCCLTLQPCRDPVVTPDGYLYDKEALLEYIIHQKKAIARKMKEYEKQRTKSQTEEKELKEAGLESQKTAFINSGRAPSGKHENKVSEPEAGPSSLCNMAADGKSKLPSFWVPNLTPSAAPTKVTKPDEKIRCPMSGRVLKLKDMIPVKFTLINDRDNKTSLIAKQARYVCAVTNDVLGNSVPCAVLKTSGNVVTMECVQKLVKKDMLDPFNGKKMQDKDIIQLQRGASGFSGAGIKLQAKKEGAALMS
ncbi:hypothetical protein ScPMuIL_016095 [Solemya velum]